MIKEKQKLIIISDSLKAMAHPDRISILSLLGSKENKLSVTQICNNLNFSQPEASRHLSILRGKGILLFERIGVNMFYSINKGNPVFSCIEKLVKK
jgi:DNA-binding transcriptional ArsR family regulator